VLPPSLFWWWNALFQFDFLSVVNPFPPPSEMRIKVNAPPAPIPSPIPQSVANSHAAHRCFPAMQRPHVVFFFFFLCRNLAREQPFPTARHDLVVFLYVFVFHRGSCFTNSLGFPHRACTFFQPFFEVCMHVFQGCALFYPSNFPSPCVPGFGPYLFVTFFLSSGVPGSSVIEVPFAKGQFA